MMGFGEGGSGGMDPFILQLGTRWNGVVSCTTGGFNPGEGAIPRAVVYSTRSRTPTIHAVAKSVYLLCCHIYSA